MQKKVGIVVFTLLATMSASVLAQPACLPDFEYKSAVGHKQGTASRTLLKTGFKAAAKKDFDAFMAIAAKPYIQHSPDLPDGWKPVWDLLANRPQGFSSQQIKWLGPQGMLDNGEYLIMFREVKRGEGEPKSKIFDLLRFDENGLYAEHWDIRQPLSDKTVLGRSETAAADEFLNNPVNYSVEIEEANKRLVVSFLNTAFNYGRLEVALDLYVSPTYVQHNPLMADGKQAMLDRFNAGKIPVPCYDVKYIFAQNDRVFVYSKVTSKGGVNAVVDLFRVRDNQLVEHWDVVQSIPTDEDMPHKNGMF